MFDTDGFNGSRFQIEANFGATVGIAEMRLQSHADVSITALHILSAAPKWGSDLGWRRWIPQVTIQSGAKVRISGGPGGAEGARVEYIEFYPHNGLK